MEERKKIIVVDDDKGIRVVSSIVLQQAGYTVFEAKNEKEMLEIVEKQKPNLILLDLWLGGQNGSVICKKLKKTPDKKNIPIIMFTANNNGETISKQSGAEGFIPKPFDIDELVATIKKLI